MVDNVKFLGVGVEQGQEFQRHKGVSFLDIYMYIVQRIVFKNNQDDKKKGCEGQFAGRWRSKVVGVRRTLGTTA